MRRSPASIDNPNISVMARGDSISARSHVGDAAAVNQGLAVQVSSVVPRHVALGVMRWRRVAAMHIHYADGAMRIPDIDHGTRSDPGKPGESSPVMQDDLLHVLRRGLYYVSLCQSQHRAGIGVSGLSSNELNVVAIGRRDQVEHIRALGILQIALDQPGHSRRIAVIRLYGRLRHFITLDGTPINVVAGSARQLADEFSNRTPVALAKGMQHVQFAQVVPSACTENGRR